MYCSVRGLPTKHPWVLGFHRPKYVGGHLYKEAISVYIHICESQDHKENGVSTYMYTNMRAYLGEYGIRATQ